MEKTLSELRTARFKLYKELVEAQDRLIKLKNNLLVSYRMQKRPSDAFFNDIQRATNKVNKLKEDLK